MRYGTNSTDGHLSKTATTRSTATTSSLPKVAVVARLNFISMQVFLFCFLSVRIQDDQTRRMVLKNADNLTAKFLKCL